MSNRIAGTLWISLLATFVMTFPATISAASEVPVNQVLATSYGASGSSQSTTGTVEAGSRILHVADALDFADGQGIAVWGAGPAFSAGPLTGVTATQQGATGSTTYSYQVAPVDYAGGIGVPVTVSVTNGNAILTTADNIQVSVTYGRGDAGFVVWKSVSGSPYR